MNVFFKIKSSLFTLSLSGPVLTGNRYTELYRSARETERADKVKKKESEFYYFLSRWFA